MAPRISFDEVVRKVTSIDSLLAAFALAFILILAWLYNMTGDPDYLPPLA
jgi:hypothetical protein